MRIQDSFMATALLMTTLVVFTAPAVFAADDDTRQGNRRHGPPQEAIDACSALTAGDTCTFVGRDEEELTGTCFAPEGKELACKPEGSDERMGKQRRDRDTN